jgi:hypothetical protein
MALERGPIPGRCAEALYARLQRVGGRAVASKVRGVGLAGAAVSADLGGSSKYSSENLED